MTKKRLLFCLVFFLSLLCVSCQKKPKANALFPETLPNLHLMKLLQGREAIKAVNKLHGRVIKVKKAWVAYYKGAFYQGNWHEATIWVSEAFTLSQAEQQVEIMMQKIMQSHKTPFYGFKKKREKGTEVYIFWGIGKQHAVFRKGKMVFWISASFEVFDDVLNHYLSV